MPPTPNQHNATESAWARRTRAERERARRADEPVSDTPTSEINAESYEQPTADVDIAAGQVKPTFVVTSLLQQSPRPPKLVPESAHVTPKVEPARAEPTKVETKEAQVEIAASATPVPEVPFAAVEPEPSPQVIAPEPSKPVAREITTGSVLDNRYLLGRLLGSGGGALIFQAEDRRRIGAEDFGNKIAIKVLRPEMRQNPHAITRLKREFRQMQRLAHPGIARVFELDCDEDVWFMTMELIDGQTINQWLKDSSSRTGALQIIAGCAAALSAAHEAGIVHGDLKPSNVLVLDSGEVKLVDFGSAAERDATTGEVDKERSFAATPPYASPQILAGEIADPRDDLFSLACLAYAVLTQGEHPFDRKSSAEAQLAQMKPAYSRALLPRQFEVIVRALSWDREHRPATVLEFWHALLASDLRREPSRDSSNPVGDAASRPIATRAAHSKPLAEPIASKPMPSTPTRDAPTIAASQLEAKPAPTAQPASKPPPKREPPIKHEDIMRLKAAIAAAETHAEHLEHPEPRGGETADAQKQFRGYVAGPMAPRDDADPADDVPGALATDPTRPPQSPPKTSKRVWPWQRSAWLLVIGAASAVAMIATRLDVPAESPAQSHALPRSIPAPTPLVETPTNIETPEPARSIEEKKSAPVEVAGPAPATVASEVSFTTRTLRVGVGQTIAALAVKRLHSTRGRARVAWTIEGGTARPGIDYRVGDPQVIEFIEGQGVRSLFIPLVSEKDVGDARTSKTFTVKLQQTTGGLKLGEIKQVYVTIVGDVADERVASAD